VRKAALDTVGLRRGECLTRLNRISVSNNTRMSNNVYSKCRTTSMCPTTRSFRGANSPANNVHTQASSATLKMLEIGIGSAKTRHVLI
jgi:hypothetical protein